MKTVTEYGKRIARLARRTHGQRQQKRFRVAAYNLGTQYAYRYYTIY